jgi:acetolactate synthase-1/2/3 large subunit
MDDLEKTVPLKPIKPSESGPKPADAQPAAAKAAPPAAPADLSRTVPLKPMPELAAAMPAPKREAPPQKPQAAAPKPESVAPQPEHTAAFKPETAADAWVGLLAARGVEYLFANGGTDFGPVVEAYAKGQKLGWRLPEVVIVPHENMGVAMAHGYAMVTGRPQAMMVHVGVGTANALNGLINASRQNVPILFTAGRTPLTESGTLPAARNNYIHWAQEHFDQGGMLREFVKWDYELKHAEQVETVLDRALAIAKSEPQGPVYVTLPREILASQFSAPFNAHSTIASASPPGADGEGIREAAKLLSQAKMPLLITANGGRTVESSRAIA